MVPEKTDMRSMTTKLKKMCLAVGFLLLVAVVGHAAELELGYDKEFAALRSRFKSIRSAYQIDAFIEELDKFSQRYPSGKNRRELERVRTYLTNVKNGLSLRFVIGTVSTTKECDTMSENDVFIEISGPVSERTPIINDNNTPTFNFPVNFVWRIDSKPLIFDVNDSDLTNNDRIGTVTVPCCGITGWKNLKGTYKGLNTRVSINLTEVPDCPW